MRGDDVQQLEAGTAVALALVGGIVLLGRLLPQMLGRVQAGGAGAPAGRPAPLPRAVIGYTAVVTDGPLPLTVQESPGRVRLCLGSLAHGDGPTLQDAADDLVQRLLTHAMAFRVSGFRAPIELGPPDLAAIDFLYELGEIAGAGGDIRSRLFG